MAAPSPSSQDAHIAHDFYLVVSNVTGRKNMGTFLRTGSAFGVKQMLVVGSDRFGTHGGHNAHKYVQVETMHTCEDAQAYLKARGCRILGLQAAGVASSSVDSHPFDGPTAFVLGNEGGCLTEDQRRICEGFVHVSHFTPQGATILPSTVFELDLTVQLGILLHNFTTWSGQYQERRMESTSTRGKFELAERKPREKVVNTAVVNQRQGKKEEVAAIMEDDLALSLFEE